MMCALSTTAIAREPSPRMTDRPVTPATVSISP
jgi:hypothetical protein